MGSKDFSLEMWDNLVKIDIERYKEVESVDTNMSPDEEAFLNYFNVKGKF